MTKEQAQEKLTKLEFQKILGKKYIHKVYNRIYTIITLNIATKPEDNNNFYIQVGFECESNRESVFIENIPILVEDFNEINNLFAPIL